MGSRIPNNDTIDYDRIIEIVENKLKLYDNFTKYGVLLDFNVDKIGINNDLINKFISNDKINQIFTNTKIRNKKISSNLDKIKNGVIFTSYDKYLSRLKLLYRNKFIVIITLGEEKICLEDVNYQIYNVHKIILYICQIRDLRYELLYTNFSRILKDHGYYFNLLNIIPVPFIINGKEQMDKYELIRILQTQTNINLSFLDNYQINEDFHTLQLLKPKVEDFGRILKHGEVPTINYFETKISGTTIHWGQRKLLMSEIEFLTIMLKNLEDYELVVYVGSAHGYHIPFLSDMFPNVEFDLYDPGRFAIKEDKMIHIFNEFFTDEIAEEYKNKNVLFISDIRRKDIEKEVEIDMRMQEKWVKIIQPKASMLKFRLPYSHDLDGKIININDSNINKDNYEYLDGDIYFGVWSPQHTTETRLISSSDQIQKKRIYHNSIYEAEMFYFNIHTRPSKYEHNIHAEGICHCYDCMSEIHILQNYIDKFNVNYKIENIISDINNFLSHKGQNLFMIHL